ncbi:MAG: hypothetical protein OXF06_05510 [Bacteroidetes bacterium]|nr:hypothetical protein [Bacteroidota bacterium]MCY4224276.1 hypothetical protein [Bacteroidota bacterium]
MSLVLRKGSTQLEQKGVEGDSHPPQENSFLRCTATSIQIYKYGYQK